MYNLQLKKKWYTVSFDWLQAHNGESTHNLLYKCEFKLLNSNLICDIIIWILLSPKRNKERLSLSNGWIPNILFKACLKVVLFDTRLVLSNLLFHRSIVDGINDLLYVSKRQRIYWISCLSVCLVMRELCDWGIRSMRYLGALLFVHVSSGLIRHPCI